MEFKGTKGKWHWEYPGGNSLATLVNEKGESICNFGNDSEYYPSEGEEPNNFDALLISKAPEMLAFLIDLVSDYENGLIEDLEDVVWRAENLIREATEL